MVAKVKNLPRARREAATLGRPSLRLALLDTAMDLIVEGGVEALTYESLAERSGLSKGGVLYHFPNREELNREVRAYVRDRYREARREMTDALPEGPSRELKGWAIAAMTNRSNLDAVCAKIMTSGLWDSAEGRAHHRERFEAISKGVGFDRAAVVYLAAEGLWFLELTQFLPFSSSERKRVFDLLLAIADGAEIASMPASEKPGLESDRRTKARSTKSGRRIEAERDE